MRTLLLLLLLLPLAVRQAFMQAAALVNENAGERLLLVCSIDAASEMKIDFQRLAEVESKAIRCALQLIEGVVLYPLIGNDVDLRHISDAY